MSVSESLALLRESAAVNRTRPRSILYTSAESSKIPLSEQAAVALNSLRALSQSNGKLLNLASDLLLLSPTERETLDPETEATLSTACILAAGYLSPIFPVRHAQRVYEWLVNGMQGGLLGSNAEIEGLLFSALPFHATAQFPPFIAALDSPNLNKRWNWLVPISRQKKPASLLYIVQNCPSSVHRRAIDWTSFLITKNVPTVYASSILVNITARWAVSASLSSRTAVALRALKALDEILICPKIDSQAVCAHLILLSICTFKGLDEEVMRVFARAIVKGFKAFLKSNLSDLLQISLRALALIFSRCHGSCLSLKDTFCVFQLPLPVLISSLSVDAPKFYGLSIKRLLDDPLSDESCSAPVTSGNGDNGSFVSQDSEVANAVEKLLELFSEIVDGEVTDGDSVQKRSNLEADPSLLTATVSLLGQSKFSDATLLGIKRYFSARGKSKTRTKGFLLVEELVNFTLASGKMELSPGTSGTELSKLASLESPDRSVRLQALLCFREQREEHSEQHENLKLWTLLMALISNESDIEVLSSACSLAIQLSAIYDPNELFRVLGSRLTNSEGLVLQGTDGHFGSAVLNTLLSLCETLSSNDTMGVCSFLVGSLFGGMFSSEPKAVQVRALCLLKSCFKRIGNCDLERADEAKNVDADIIVATSISMASSLDSVSFSEVSRFLFAVSKWKVLWLFDVASTWMSQSTAHCSESQISLRVQASLTCLRKFVADLSCTQIDRVLTLCLETLSSHPISSDINLTCSSLIWKFGLSSRHGTVSARTLCIMSKIQGIDHVLRVLNHTFQTEEDDLTRKLSLRWNLSLALSENSEHRVKKALDDILIVYYGNNNCLRNEVIWFCQNALRGKFGKKMTSSTKQLLLSLPTLSSLRSNTPPEIRLSECTNPGSVVSSYLHRYVLYPFSQKHKLPSSLLAASPSSTFVQNLESSLGSILKANVACPTLLSLLRAFEGYTLTTKGVVSNMCNMLKSLFEHASADDSSLALHFDTELIARCVSFLVGLPSNLRPNGDVSVTLKAGLSALSVVMSRDAFTNEQMGLARFTVLAACAALFLAHSSDEKSDTLGGSSGSIVQCLCSQSLRSSIAGEFSSSYLDTTVGNLISLSDLLIYLRNLRDFLVKYCDEQNYGKEVEEENNLSEVGVGALCAIQRYLEQCKELQLQGLGSELKSLVWQILNVLCLNLPCPDYLLGEYHHQALLSALGILRCLCLSGEQCIEDRDENSLSVLFYLLRHFHTTASNTELGIKVSSLRSAIFTLLDVLKAVRVAPNLMSEILPGLLSEDSPESKLCAQKLVMFLDRSGGDKSCMPKLLLDSIYGEKKATCKSSTKSIIGSCFQSITDPKRTLESFLNGMVPDLEGELSPATIGSEYALWLVNSGLPTTSCLEIIFQAKDSVQCHITSSYLMQPEVIAEVSMILSDDDGSSGRETKTTLEKQLCCLLLSVASFEEHMSREDATRIILSIFPLPTLHTVLVEILECPVYEKRLRNLVSFTERLAEMRSKFSKFRSTSKGTDGLEGEGGTESEGTVFSILKTLCERLDSLCSSPGDELTELREVARAVEVVMKSDAGRGRSIVLSSILKAAAFLQACSEKVRADGHECAKFASMARSFFSLFSTAISKFKEQAISIIPTCLAVSTSFIETVFGQGSKNQRSVSNAWMTSVVAIVEGAIQVCVSVIDSTPLFFGEDALERLCVQVLLRDTRSIRDVVNIALEEVPLTTSLNALQRANEHVEAPCLNGLGSILRCLEHSIGARNKAEVKVEGTRLLEFGIGCLKEVNDGKLWNGVYTNKQTLDETFGNFVVSLALRLPESEFEKAFKKLVQWSGTDTPYETASVTSSERGATLEASILRLIPFYRATDKLLQRLGSMMLPFLMFVLNNIIAIISDIFEIETSGESEGHLDAQKHGQLAGKKRKKDSSFADLVGRLTDAHHELQDVCLKILTSFLALSSASGLDESLVVNLIQALLTYFEVHHSTSNRALPALCALGVHVSTMCSLPDINERGRQLLLVLSRELLSRTKSPQADLRRGTLVAAKAIAVAVGVEYIVTIPESLPMIAEVMDDENVNVRKAAKDYIVTLEAISGERLVDQVS